jgi:epoxyqueuosine reductase
MEKLLLHACCAPCSPYVLEKLSGEYELSVLFYNPNIQAPEEYQLRLAEMRRLCASLGVRLIEGRYDPERYIERVGPLAVSGEGGERCSACFSLRLEEACRVAKETGASLVATTLTVSPHKNTSQVNRAGLEAARNAGIAFFDADFKKNDGWRISCRKAREYGFYRQDYCGCHFSKAESELRKNSHQTHRGG